jgi:DNA-binding protein
MDNNVLFFETRSAALGKAVDLVNLIQNSGLSEADMNEIFMDAIEFINESQPN